MNYIDQLELLITQALQEDIGPGDYSTLATIDEYAEGKAVLKIKQDGILAGVQVAAFIFRHLEPGIRFTAFKHDGDLMGAGETAFEIEGRVRTVLQAERLVLNSMQRMSGIATLTSKYVKKLKGYRTKLLDTRKTTPNFRLLEKEAVRIGGAVNHRFGLYDMVMLKDNHIDYCGGIAPAVERAHAYLKANGLNLKIEVETRNLADVEAALRTGKVDRIMLDNFTVDLINEAVALINYTCETEASGGIHLENIEAYAATGVDFISSGAIIHQAQSLDLSLKAVIKN